MKFAADENFDNRFLRGLLHKLPDLDIVRVQDTEMYQKSAPALLEWIARENRILLTHDFNTIPKYAYERIVSNLAMPGVIMVDSSASISVIVDDLQIMIEAGTSKDFENRIEYIPFK